MVLGTRLTQLPPQQDDEFDEPYLAGFEWNKEESYTKFFVHQKKEGAPVSKKAKKKEAAAGAA
jgi:hypothetical protein